LNASDPLQLQNVVELWFGTLACQGVKHSVLSPTHHLVAREIYFAPFVSFTKSWLQSKLWSWENTVSYGLLLNLLKQVKANEA